MYVTCHVANITCHLFLTPTVIDPLPANSPNIYSRLVSEDPQQKILKKNLFKQSRKRNVF